MPSIVQVVLRLDTKPASFAREIMLGKESAANAANYQKKARTVVQGLQRLLEGAVGGIYTSNLWLSIYDAGSPAAAPTAVIGCTRADAVGHYVRFTFGTVAITLTEGVDFVRGAADANTATNLAAAINAHPVLSTLFSAAGDSGDCDITGKIPGSFLTDVAITTDETDAFDITGLADGAEGAAEFFPTHILLNRLP